MRCPRKECSGNFYFLFFFNNLHFAKMPMLKQSYHDGRNALKQRGGLYAVMAKCLKGVIMPDTTLAKFGGDFTANMEMQTNWMHDGRRLTMFAYVTPFLAFFCDSRSIVLLSHHKIRQVSLDPAFKVEYVEDQEISVYIEDDIAFTFHFGSINDQAVQAAVAREIGTEKVQSYLAMTDRPSPNPTQLTECAELPVSYACTACQTVVFAKASLKACAKCRCVFYCNRECQKANWPEHKPFCGK